jgi:hypothetical protein
MEKVTVEQHSFVGIAWFGAWLFSIGFLQLTFWKGVFAILLWPYYLGVTLSSVLRRGNQHCLVFRVQDGLTE